MRHNNGKNLLSIIFKFFADLLERKIVNLKQINNVKI